MSAEYKLLVRSKAGAKLTETSDFLELAYTKRVNQPGLLKFRLRGDHALVDQLQEDYQVEVHRRNPVLNLDWYPDFYGFYASSVIETRQQTTFTATAPGQMNLLARRIIAYYANLANRSSFTGVKSETLLKTLVRYNATADATTAHSRDRSGAFSAFTVSIQTDAAQGNTITWAGSRKNLLSELQRIAEVAGGDFDLVKTGATTWQYRFYPGQLGIDRSASVVFSLSMGNMANPKIVRTAAAATVAIIGGQGREDVRAVQFAGDTAGDGPELFVDGRNDADTAALVTRGEIALEGAAARTAFTFDVVQTPRSYYGLHYGLGDLVSAEYGGLSEVVGVRGVSVAVKDGNEDIVVETE